MSFMNKYNRDLIYAEMEGKTSNSGSNIASKITASVLLIAIGFASGSIYSTFNASKTLNATEPTSTNNSSILTTATQKSDVINNIVTNSVSGIVKACADSVVEITIETTSSYMSYEYTAEGNGSGVIISKDGYILTNNHVIDGANKVKVTLRNGEEHEAKLIGKDSKTDTAVVKIEATNLTYAILGDTSKLEVGDLAVVIGNPLGELGGSVTSGIISALEREITIYNIKEVIIEGNTYYQKLRQSLR